MSYQLASADDREAVATRDGAAAASAFRGVVGRSRRIREVVEFAARIARRSHSTVLISGETGTGKELFARGIHYAGPAPGEPFVAVNCPAIPASLLESELFGHEEGAFTDARSRKKGLLELAGRGTLFLDEVTDLPADLQPKLLRALEERRVRRLGGFDEVHIHCRVIAATNRSLEEAVAEGKFREDLFYRLNVLRVSLPPLRQREDDVVLLAEHFAREVALEQGLDFAGFTARAIEALKRHTWPGNVRELRNVIHRAVVLGQGPTVDREDLRISQRGRGTGGGEAEAGRVIRIPDSGLSLEAIEAEAIRHTLEITRGNQSAACRILGISRPTLLRKIRRYGLERGGEARL